MKDNHPLVTSGKSSHWPAPAKLNLFLHITGRRHDGYHELQTLFQFLSHCDSLDFRVTDSPSLILHSQLNHIVPQSDNLILRAAKLLQEASGCKLGAEIWLDKNLPMGGGLGGGSSNAATTLVALNTLWNTRFTPSQLAEIGLGLGADIPVFIHGVAAFAQGVGEQLQPCSPKELWYLVITPDVHVSTKEIFQHPALKRNSPHQSMEALNAAPWENDCQSLVVAEYPQVAKALSWLLKYAPSRMSGTGACVFGEFSSKQQALDVFAKRPSGMQGFVAKGTNQSPLELRLRQL